MKKILIAVSISLLFTACGVGNYTVSSGKADEGAISFTSAKAEDIVVSVDNTTYEINSVKDKAYRTDRKIKQTASNTIRLAPGAHDVKVEKEGQVVFSKKLYISASEHKIIEL